MGNTLRDLQLCELEILKEVKRVCQKHNITYYLSSGTLLGAVRHGGFIPWDDDVDIEMPYSDYKRFIAIAQEELEEEYFLQNEDTDSGYYRLFTKVRKNNTTMISSYGSGSGNHQGVWVDIFPIISIGGTLDYYYRKLCVRICNYAMFDRTYFDKDRRWIRSQTNAFMFHFTKWFIKLPISFRRKVYFFFKRMVFIRADRKTKRKGHVWAGITYIHPACVFEGEPKLLPFEDDVFPVPSGYEEYLTNAYGDYMTPPPEDKRNGGHGDVIIDLEHSWENYIPFEKSHTK